MPDSFFTLNQFMFAADSSVRTREPRRCYRAYCGSASISRDTDTCCVSPVKCVNLSLTGHQIHSFTRLNSDDPRSVDCGTKWHLKRGRRWRCFGTYIVRKDNDTTCCLQSKPVPQSSSSLLCGLLSRRQLAYTQLMTQQPAPLN